MTDRAGLIRPRRMIVQASARRFTLLDGMVLIAATAVGFAWFRFTVAPMFGSSSGFLRQSVLRKFDTVFNHVLPPFLVSWGVAIFALKRLRSRLPFRQLVTKPGMAACGLAFLGLIYSGLWMCVGWLCGGRNVRYHSRFSPLLLDSIWSGQMVVGVWLTLMISGVARHWWRDADGYEWCGVAIGCCWIVGMLITHAIHFAL